MCTLCRWMDTECWEKVVRFFIENIPRVRVPARNVQPGMSATEREQIPWVILFFDNLRSHVNRVEVHDMLREQHIQPITFMPNTTDYCQPIDQEMGSAYKACTKTVFHRTCQS